MVSQTVLVGCLYIQYIAGKNNEADFHILIVVSSAWDWYQLWPGLIGGRVRD